MISKRYPSCKRYGKKRVLVNVSDDIFDVFCNSVIILENMAVFTDKNEPSRFLGDGVTFKAKLIGILEVEEARGDRMCQEALFELKMAVRAAGEHKQRINIVIAIDGIRLRDEKTGVCDVGINYTR